MRCKYVAGLRSGSHQIIDQKKYVHYCIPYPFSSHPAARDFLRTIACYYGMGRG